jgi:hypothetical protein
MLDSEGKERASNEQSEPRAEGGGGEEGGKTERAEEEGKQRESGEECPLTF